MLPGGDAEQLLSTGIPIQVAQSPDFHEVSKKRYSFASGGGTRVSRLVMLPPWLPLAGTAAQHSRVTPFEGRFVKADWHGSVAAATCCLSAPDDPISEPLETARSLRLAEAK
ncbi:Hypothetical protein, putative [Bodo saltans]|nr:Hypothetical protein, putative [Bodo saltans]|eukprot:CUI14784.1 Hypothetical protein, putative [Bodo saltans]